MYDLLLGNRDFDVMRVLDPPPTTRLSSRPMRAPDRFRSTITLALRAWLLPLLPLLGVAVLLAALSWTTSRPSAATADIRFGTWVEPREHAFSLEVPADWRLEGGVNWLGPIDPQAYVVVTSPDGTLRVFVGDPELLTRQVPSATTRMQTGAREGQTFRTATGSPALVQRFLTGPQYARQHVSWRLCQSPLWVAQQDLPDLSRALTDAVTPYARSYGARVQASAGEVSYLCGAAQGAVFAATMITSSHTGPIQVWMVYRVAGFQSTDSMRTMVARYVMEHMLATVRLDPRWNAAVEEKARRRTGMVISMQNAATQAALAASRQQNETLARMNHPNPGVPRRTESGGSSSGVNTILGTRHVCDAIGRCKTVEIGDGNVFVDHSGNFRTGPPSGGPPDNSGVWSPAYPQ